MPRNKTPLELRAEWLAQYYTKEELAYLLAKAEHDAVNSPLVSLAQEQPYEQ